MGHLQHSHYGPFQPDVLGQTWGALALWGAALWGDLGVVGVGWEHDFKPLSLTYHLFFMYCEINQPQSITIFLSL